MADDEALRAAAIPPTLDQLNASFFGNFLNPPVTALNEDPFALTTNEIHSSMEAVTVECGKKFPAVAYLQGRGHGGGTGFLVAPRRLLTTSTILDCEKTADNTRCIFNYRGKTEANWKPVKLQPLEFFFGGSKAGLGYTICAVEEPDDEMEYIKMQVDKDVKMQNGDAKLCYDEPLGPGDPPGTIKACALSSSPVFMVYHPYHRELGFEPLTHCLTTIRDKLAMDDQKEYDGMQRLFSLDNHVGNISCAGSPVMGAMRGTPLLGVKSSETEAGFIPCRVIGEHLAKEGIAWQHLGERGKEMAVTVSRGQGEMPGEKLRVPGLHGTTIMSAYDKARAGDTIVVSAGVYHEQLVLSKEVEIRGESLVFVAAHVGKERVCIQSEAGKQKIVFNGASHEVVWRRAPKAASSSGPIMIASVAPYFKGEVVLANGCSFENPEGQPGVDCQVMIEFSGGPVVLMDGAEGPRLSNLKIRHRLCVDDGSEAVNYDGVPKQVQGTHECGIEVFNFAPWLQPYIEFCDVVAETTDPNSAAVVVRKDAAPVFTRCHVHNSRSHGILIKDQGKGIYKYNKVYANAGAGVKVEGTDKTPRFKDNEISNGRAEGILLQNAYVSFQSNRVSCNNAGNIVLDDDGEGRHSDGFFEKNTIFDSATSGIILRHGSRGTFLRNTITGNKKCGMLVETNADPVIVEENTFANSPGIGIQINSGGRGWYKENKIVSCGGAGLLLSGKGVSPDGPQRGFEFNKVSQCENGIIIESGACGDIKSNAVFEHLHCGIVVRGEGTDPLIMSNTVGDNCHDGVWLTDQCKGTLEGNIIVRNKGSAILLNRACDPVVQNANELGPSNRYGISCWDKGLGQVKGSKIFENLEAGVNIMNAGDCLIEKCEIYKNCGPGVHVHHHGYGTIRECKIHSNQNSNVLCTQAGDPTVQNCSIFNGSRTGILIEASGKGNYHENHVYENTEAGIQVMGHSYPQVISNSISKGKQFGVLVTQRGQGVFEENKIFENQWAAVSITTQAHPVLRGNQIYQGEREGIYVLDHGRGIIAGNAIYSNKHSGVGVAFHAEPVFTDNSISRGQSEGVWVGDNGKGIFEQNDIFENAKGEVLITECGNPLLRQNNIHDSTQAGVTVDHAGKGQLRGNFICLNKGPNVFVTGRADPEIMANHIGAGKSEGLLISDHAKGVYQGNELHGNHIGVKVTDNANPTLHTNKITSSVELGLHITDGAHGEFHENEIYMNSHGGVMIQGQSAPLLQRNRIYNNPKEGLVIEKSGGSYERNSVSGNGDTGIKLDLKNSRVLPTNFARNDSHHNVGYGLVKSGDCADMDGLETNDIHSNEKGNTLEMP